MYVVDIHILGRKRPLRHNVSGEDSLAERNAVKAARHFVNEGFEHQVFRSGKCVTVAIFGSHRIDRAEVKWVE